MPHHPGLYSPIRLILYSLFNDVMIMEELKKKLNLLCSKMEGLRKTLRIEIKSARIKELQTIMAESAFWADPKSAAVVLEELKEIKCDVDSWAALNHRLIELGELISLKDDSLEREIEGELTKCAEEVDFLRLQLLFSDKFDNCNAILEINSGAGGTEACDWASMLFRMYFRWSENKKFKFKILNEVKGEEAGLKNITFIITGPRAYGLIKSEVGVHRLVRISPFDSNKRRHTSFASVDVIPEIKEDIEIEIQPEELKIDTYRASGAGGQHVNVTDSAVRITHLPTNIVVCSQNERSQHQNKHTAMKILKSKLYKLKEEENRQEMEKISGNKQKIEWGSQIRSYVLHPYLMVKDHRTSAEMGDAWGVLDGKLDKFIYSYLDFLAESKADDFSL